MATTEKEGPQVAIAPSDGDVEKALNTVDGDEPDYDETMYTESITSSVNAYVEENGRRYSEKHKNYLLPKDDAEMDRLDLIHEIFRLRLEGKLYVAPIGNPQRILDIGTGTGLWAIEMGDQFPSTEVIGTDINATQPTWVPPNVKFEIDDANKEWMFREPFDYIHCRFMAGAITDWPALMAQAFRHTRPGGWVEFLDFDGNIYSEDGTFDTEGPVAKWVKFCMSAVEKIGSNLAPGPSLKGWVEDAGFTNVKHANYPIPIGTWPKDETLRKVGALDWTQIHQGLEGMSLRMFTQVLGWDEAEALYFLGEVRKGFRKPGCHALHDVHVVYAQKPE